MDESFFEAAERAALSALEEARKKLRLPVRSESFDGKCIECGEDVPVARAALGYDHCIYCQTSKEQRSRLTR